MDSEIEQLSRFIPKFIQERLSLDPRVPQDCVSEALDALVLFADISGFTPLSIQLAEIGPEGSEELDRVLNEYYGRLVHLVAAYGGDVVAFAGDAAICVWPVVASSAAVHVAECALQIQQELHDYSVGNGIRLSVSISIGAGSLTMTNVGGLNAQWHPMVVGEALDQIGLAGELATSGEIVMTAGAVASAEPGWVIGDPLTRGHLRLKRLVAQSKPRITPAPELDRSAGAAIRSFIPQNVLVRFDAGQSSWLADLRHLTVVFIRLHGISLRDGERYGHCQSSMLQFQQAMQRYEGEVLHFLQDDKGIIAVLCFGLPPHIHEDDAYRAIRSAFSIQSALTSIDLSADIGIGTGRIFSGVRGGAERCEYSITGHVVNLAARLMSIAEGGIVCDASTRQAVRSGVHFDPLPDLQLKGISEPVSAFRPALAAEIDEKHRTVLVGRRPELDRIKTWIEQEGEIQSQVLLLEGEAGIGKSVLLADISDLSIKHGMRVILVECDAIERTTPYFVWRAILSELLGTSRIVDRQEQKTRVEEFCKPDAQLASRLSLLNPFLGTDFEESTIHSQLSSEARATLTSEMVVAILAKATSQTPLMLAVDDVQWLDSASWNIFAAISRRSDNCRLALAARPLSGSEMAESRQLLDNERILRLELGNLSRSATASLVCAALNVERLDEALLGFLYDRSEGNPFFVQELVHFLQESGLVRVESRTGKLNVRVDDEQQLTQVPTSMRALITNRVDRLAPAQQMTIKTASIVGRSFAKKTLLAVYEVESERSQLDKHLEQISQLRLIQVDSLIPEVSYLFQHLTVQQVVYDQIPVRNRKVLHAAIAKWYEQSRATDPGFYPLLAYHWGHAQVVEKQVAYLAKSGQEALKRFANLEAVTSFTAALKQSERLDPQRRPTRMELGRWQRQLGEAEFHLGNLNAAKRHFELALAEFGQKSVRNRVGLLLGTAFQIARQAWHRGPLANVNKGVVLDAENDAGRFQERAIALQWISQIHYFQVDVSKGINCALWALNLAERAGMSPLLARAYSGMCLVTGMLRLHPISKMYARLSRNVSEQVNDIPTISYVLMATGVYRLGIGQWDLVREQAQRSIHLARQIGDPRLLVEAITVEAMRHSLLANFREAEQVYSEVYEIARRSENKVHLGWSFSGTGECQFRRGETEAAMASFIRAQESLASSEHVTEEIRLHGLLAASLWRVGRKTEAVEAAAKALEFTQKSYATVSTLEGIAAVAEVCLGYLRQSPDNRHARNLAGAACDCLKQYARLYPVGTSRSFCWRGLYHHTLGRQRKAIRFWHKSIDWAQHHGLVYDEAFARWNLARYGAIDPKERSAQHDTATATFEQLDCAYELRSDAPDEAI